MKRSIWYKLQLGGSALLLVIATAAATPAASPQVAGKGGRGVVSNGKVARTDAQSNTVVNANLSASADFALSWYSFNGGGTIGGTSPTLGLSESIGESASGHGSSSAYMLEMGFLANAKSCNCPFQSDIDEDGFVTPLDLGSVIDILFLGAPNLHDPDCPTMRADFDCNGFAESTDLGLLIDYIFINGSPPCIPCIDYK